MLSVLLQYFKRGEAHLEGIQYSKIIRSLTAELKHLETQVNDLDCAAPNDLHTPFQV